MKVLLLDADGVLFTGEPYFVMLERTGTIDIRAVNNFFNGVFQECLIGEYPLERALETLLSQTNLNKSVNQIMSEWFEYEDVIDTELLSTLTMLKQTGVEIYLTTNQEKQRLNHLLNLPQIKDLVAGSYSSCDVKCLKSDPKFYKNVIDSLSSTNITKIYFTDDSIENINVANQCGIDSRLYTNVSDFNKHTASEFNS